MPGGGLGGNGKGGPGQQRGHRKRGQHPGMAGGRRTRAAVIGVDIIVRLMQTIRLTGSWPGARAWRLIVRRTGEPVGFRAGKPGVRQLNI